MGPAESHALMQRELDEQPVLMPEIAERLTAAAADMRPNPGRPVWAGGCGDSLFAAQALGFYARRAGYDLRPASAAEMLWDAPIAEGDTVIGISISGSTKRTVEALEMASQRGARTIAITLNAESALGEAADDRLILPYTPISRAIPHGLDYHVTLVALAALFADVPAGQVGAVFSEATAPALETARDVVGGLTPEARFSFLGGGSALGSANFGAAKLHEAGGLDAWSFEAENFAHGGLFVPRPGDLAVLCGSSGPADARTAALAPELGRLGLHVIRAGLDRWTSPLDAALAAGLQAQALCLAVAEARDLDVTDPGQGSEAAAVQKTLFDWRAL
ncbi:MAG: SIS domain-containing protein [Pseudomonadota bacterium]